MGSGTSKQSHDPSPTETTGSHSNDDGGGGASTNSIQGNDGLPTTTTPIWKATTALVSDTNSLPCPFQCQLWGPRHHQAYMKRTLRSSSLGNHSETLKIQTGLWGGILVLQLQDQIIAVVKHKKIYSAMPCYEHQPPSKFKYKGGMRLYKYARLREGSTNNQSIVSLVRPTTTATMNPSSRSPSTHQKEPTYVDQFTILNGPMNSYSKQVFQWQKTTTTTANDDSNTNNITNESSLGMMQSILAAEWKYANSCTTINIRTPDVDVALILLLIPMWELLDTEIQMRKAGRQAIAG